jgi:hypothetical protein
VHHLDVACRHHGALSRAFFRAAVHQREVAEIEQPRVNAVARL